ncbi:MAG: hypothetical protein ACFFG0_10485 [Candidatus Thorarchaeota archaeon]
MEMKERERQEGKKEAEKDTDYLNTCRVCKKIIDGGRYNDHYNPMGDADDAPDQPICQKCATENPDDFHKEFRRRYID